MRELKECKAEIFRRSENRIRERRKKRSQLLWCAVPFCLGIGIWSATILPEMLSTLESGRDDAAYENEIVDVCSSFIQVELRKEGELAAVSEKITDVGEIVNIQNVIESLYQEHLAEDDMEDEAEALGSEEKEFETQAEKEYVITCVVGDGTERVYLLRENVLIDTENRQGVVLSAGQRDELCLLLGITE